MISEADIIRRIRRDIGDPGEPFQTTARGTGHSRRFELPVERVGTTVRVYEIVNGNIQNHAEGTDYALDRTHGVLTLTGVLGDGELLIVEGTAHALFTDEELSVYVNDAMKKHVGDRTVSTRYRTENGFISYVELPMDLGNLPPVEESLVAMLATIDVLWSLATDASTDIDVVTAEGTHIPRAQRFQQLMGMISALSQRYHETAQQLNVGLYKIEMSTLRRRSLTTGRLVPVYQEREYDDHRAPTRLLPPIDSKDEDESGIANPAYGRTY